MRQWSSQKERVFPGFDWSRGAPHCLQCVRLVVMRGALTGRSIFPLTRDRKDLIVPRGSPVVCAIAENEYCCCLRDRTTSFSACVISRFLRSEDLRPHNSLEKSRPIGPPKNSKSGSACPHVLYVNSPYIAFQMISGIIYKGDCLSPMRLPPKGANT